MRARLDQVNALSHETTQLCYHCHKCTAGCPVSAEMTYGPDRILQLVHLGQKAAVLASADIWLCLGCETCGARCPNDIDIARVIDTLRKISVKEGKAKDLDTWQFDKFFLESVKKHGRLYEVETIMKYKLAKMDLFSDTKMGITMMAKGRMGLLPHNIKDKRGMKALFEKAQGE